MANHNANTDLSVTGTVSTTKQGRLIGKVDSVPNTTGYQEGDVLLIGDTFYALEDIDGTLTWTQIELGNASELTVDATLNASSTNVIQNQAVGKLTTTNGTLATVANDPGYSSDTSAQLALKGYVDTAVSTNTAVFLGTYDAHDDLGLTVVDETDPTNEQIAVAIASQITFPSGFPTNNDYVFVQLDYGGTGNANEFRRFKFRGVTWAYEYTLNNSTFTEAQWAAINSGATTTNIGAISGKLDKVTNSAVNAVYGVTSSGNQQMYTLSYSAGGGAGSVPVRDAGGVINTATPTADAHAATKKYVDDADAGKLDKVTTPAVVYTVNGSGNQTTTPISNLISMTAESVVQRTSDKQIFVPTTPTNDNHATSKKYVDDGLANKMDDFILTGYAYSAGVQELKFMTVDYSDTDSENGVLIKFGLVSGHGNGTAYSFLEDLIVRVKPDGTVNVDAYRYFAEKIWVQGDYYAVRFYGDIFWVQDTANQVVEFYALIGQYSSFKMTPYRRLNLSTKGTITQHTGYATAYSSGTKVWGNVDNFSTISDKLDKSGGTMTGALTVPTISATNISIDNNLVAGDFKYSGNRHGTSTPYAYLGMGSDYWVRWRTLAEVQSDLGITGKLDKVTYEWNKELAVSVGTAGYVLVFDGYMYDSNLTIDFDCTTGNTYHGTLVIATQNSVPASAVVYGDPSGTITSSLYIVPPTGQTADADRRMKVYFVPQGWSKNLVHVRGQGLYVTANTPASCPMEFTTGSVPEGATWRPANALDTKVDKITSGANTVYGYNNATHGQNFNAAYGASAETIPIRDTGGVVSVGTPTADAHATTKAYVDGLIANIPAIAGTTVNIVEVD